MTASMATALYLSMMAFVMLCDWFDRFFKATSYRLDAGEAQLFPDRRICWGIITNVRWNLGGDTELRFFRMKIPFLRTWGPIYPYSYYPGTAPEGFRAHWVQWIERGSPLTENPYLGWRIEPALPT